MRRLQLLGLVLTANAASIRLHGLCIVDLLGHCCEDLVKGWPVFWVHVGEANTSRLLQVDELAQVSLGADNSIRNVHLVAECGKPKYELWVSCQVDSEGHPLTARDSWTSNVCGQRMAPRA